VCCRRVLKTEKREKRCFCLQHANKNVYNTISAIENLASKKEIILFGQPHKNTNLAYPHRQERLFLLDCFTFGIAIANRNAKSVKVQLNTMGCLLVKMLTLVLAPH
jgi:hypothetical protein